MPRRLPAQVLVGCIWFLLAARPAAAQNADLKNLWREVTSGDMVRVKEASGQETRGVFARLSDSSLAITVNGQPIEIRTADIREIRRRGDSPVGGLLLGAAIGAGAAAALFYRCEDLTTTYCMELQRGTIIGAAVGAGLGAFVDTAIRGWTVAFRDNGTSFVLAPAVLPSARGVSARLTITVPRLF